MAEEISFAKRILGQSGRQEPAMAVEGQDVARAWERQANAFSIDFLSAAGRAEDGFGWSHFLRFRLEDDGDKEMLTIFVGGGFAEITGYNLEVVIADVRSAQLSRIRERNSREVMALLHSNPDNDPIIEKIQVYPTAEMLKRRIIEEFEGKKEGGRT